MCNTNYVWNECLYSNFELSFRLLSFYNGIKYFVCCNFQPARFGVGDKNLKIFTGTNVRRQWGVLEAICVGIKKYFRAILLWYSCDERTVSISLKVIIRIIFDHISPPKKLSLVYNKAMSLKAQLCWDLHSWHKLWVGTSTVSKLMTLMGLTLESWQCWYLLP